MEVLFPSGTSPSGKERELLDEIPQVGDRVFSADSVIYHNFPTCRDYESLEAFPNFLILSRKHGVLIVGCCEESSLELEENLDQVYAYLESSFKKSPLLRKSKKDLAFPLETIIFQDRKEEVNDAVVITKLVQISEILGDDTLVDDDVFEEIRSIVEGAKAIGAALKRNKIERSASIKGAIVEEISSAIKSFDVEQRKVSLSLVQGPQRIRGLAGSGKTIVLAMKVAQIHLANPESQILFTFHTKSLIASVKVMISAFYRHFAETEPNWKVIDILHSWGGAYMEGVCSNAANDNGTICPKFSEAKNQSPNDPFGYVCSVVASNRVKPKYDFILIDEAQDLPNEFFHLCYHLAHGEKGKDKCIVWAYDELQSIFKIYQRTPQELFGNDDDGKPRIDLDLFSNTLRIGQSNDLVLKKCYRNPLPVLIAAHALGFGLYAEKPVQMLENREHWQDVGYDIIENDECLVGKQTVIHRPAENSPLLASDTFDELEIIKTFVASSNGGSGIIEEAEWVCGEIKQSIEDGLRAEEILVISVDDRSAKEILATVSRVLGKIGIGVHDIHNTTSTSPSFRVDNRVTLSTVHKAKGNEAMMVFVMGVHGLYSERKFRGARNKIFTAFTRTKAWLRVSGLGEQAQFFVDELNAAVSNSPDLVFKFPDLEKMRTIQRDLGERSAVLNKFRQSIDDLKTSGMSDEEIKDILGLE